MPYSHSQMRRQWNAIANRNAFYGVFSAPEFEVLEEVDREKFWESGRHDVESFLSRLNLGNTRSRSMVEISTCSSCPWAFDLERCWKSETCSGWPDP